MLVIKNKLNIVSELLITERKQSDMHASLHVDHYAKLVSIVIRILMSTKKNIHRVVSQ